MPGENDIEIVIRAQNLISGEIQRLRTDVQTFGQAFVEAGNRISGLNQTLAVLVSAIKNTFGEATRASGDASRAIRKHLKDISDDTVSTANAETAALTRREEAFKRLQQQTANQATTAQRTQTASLSTYMPGADPRPESIRRNQQATQAWLNPKDTEEMNRRNLAWNEYVRQMERAKALQDELAKSAPAGVFTRRGDVNQSAMTTWLRGAEGTEALQRALATLDTRYATIAKAEDTATSAATALNGRMEEQIQKARSLVAVLNEVIRVRTEEAEAIQSAVVDPPPEVKSAGASARVFREAFARQEQLADDIRAYRENQARQRAIAIAQVEATAPRPSTQGELWGGTTGALGFESPGTQGTLPGLSSDAVRAAAEFDAFEKRIEKARLLLQAGYNKVPGLDPDEFVKAAAAAGGLVEQLELAGANFNALKENAPSGVMAALAAEGQGLAQVLATVSPALAAFVNMIQMMIRFSPVIGILALLAYQLRAYAQRTDEAVRATVQYNRAIGQVNTGPMLQAAESLSVELDTINQRISQGILSVPYWQQQFSNLFTFIINKASPAELAMEKLNLAARKFSEGMPGFARREELSGTERMANLRAAEARYTLYEVQGAQTLQEVQRDITENYAKAHQARLGMIEMERTTSLRAARDRWNVDEEGRVRNRAETAERAREIEKAYQDEVRLIEMRTTQSRELSKAEEATANQRRSRMIEARQREFRAQPIETEIKISKASMQGMQAELQTLQSAIAETATANLTGVLNRMGAITRTLGTRNVDVLRLQGQLEKLRLQPPPTADELFQTGRYKTERLAEAAARARQGDYDRQIEIIDKITAYEIAAAQQVAAAQTAAFQSSRRQILRQREAEALQTPLATAKTQQELAQMDRQLAQAQLVYATPDNYREMLKAINDAAAAESYWAKVVILEEYKVASVTAQTTDQKKKAFQDFQDAMEKQRKRGAVDEDARQKHDLNVIREQNAALRELNLLAAQGEQQIIGIREQAARTRLGEAGAANWQEELQNVTQLSEAAGNAQLNIAIKTLELALERANTEKEINLAWANYENQYNAWVETQVTRTQALEQLARDARRKFQIDQPAQIQQMRFQVGDINQATTQMRAAYEQMQARDVDLLPAEVQEAVVRRAQDTVLELQDLYRAGEDKIIADRRALEIKDLEWKAREYPKNAQFYLDQIRVLQEKFAAEDAQRSQRQLNEDYQRHQEYLSRLRQLYEDTPIFRGLTRQLQQFESDFGNILGQWMTGELRSWQDAWNQIWKAMARNAATYLADEMFTPVRDMWKEHTNTIVNEAAQTGKSVTQGPLQSMWEGAKALWQKLTGGEQTRALEELAQSGAGAPGGAGISDTTNAQARANMQAAALATEEAGKGLTESVGDALSPAQLTISTWAGTTEQIFATWASESMAVFQAMAARSGGGGGGFNIPSLDFSSDSGGGAGGLDSYSNPYNIGAGEAGGIWGYASGDVITKPTVGLIGEAGPELILPLSNQKRTQELLQDVGLAYMPMRKFADGGAGLPLSWMPETQRWGSTLYQSTATGGWTPSTFRRSDAELAALARILRETEGGGRGDTGPVGEPGAYGPMSPGMERGMGMAAGMIGAFSGAPVGLAGMGLVGVSKATRALGGVSGYGELAGAPTEAEVQGAYDYGGAYAGAAAKAAREAAIAKSLEGYADVAASFSSVTPGPSVDVEGLDTASMTGLGRAGGMLGGDLAGIGLAPGDNRESGFGGGGFGGGLGGPEGGFGGGFGPGGAETGTDASPGSVGNDANDSASCFIAGMRVLMADESVKPIEALEVGDVVLSWDETAKAFAAGVVAETFPTAGRADIALELVNVLLAEGVEIVCTPQHRFLLQDGQWVEAVNLPIGATLVSGRGVGGVLRFAVKGAGIYNVRVEPHHTYVVEGQVVHNWKALGGVRTARRATREVFGEKEPELGIFVTESMQQPGRQGEEERVIETMIRVLAKLTGRKVEDFAVPMAEGGVVTRDGVLAKLHKNEAVVPLGRSTDSVTPGKQPSGGTTVINVFREEDFQAAMATAVARGSRVVVNDIMQGLAGNRAIRRSIQRTS